MFARVDLVRHALAPVDCVFSVDSLRRLGGFAGNVFGENLLYQAGRNLGSLLIGRFLGAAASASTRSRPTSSSCRSPARGSAPAGVLPGVLGAERDRERAWQTSGSVRAPRRNGLGACARRPRGGRSGLRRGRSRSALERGHAGDPDPRVVGLIQSLQTLSGEVLLALGRANWLFRFAIVWFVGSRRVLRRRSRVGHHRSRGRLHRRTACCRAVPQYLASRALGIPVSRFVTRSPGSSRPPP